MKSKPSGFAIALAWPQTFCKQPGSWYDPLASWLGVNKNHYYRVGHAAVVLIDAEKRQCHYFDFGRYHAPFQYGRVRGAETDHELTLNTEPLFTADHSKIENILEILTELKKNQACHGEGELIASYCQVDFQAALKKAVQMQQTSHIPYGPFRIHGSNCSRFVSSVIRAGKPAWRFRFRLKYGVWITPTPLNNVNSLEFRVKLPDRSGLFPFVPSKKLDPQSLASTLRAPEKHPDIPDNAQWLSGEGAGSWFVLEHKDACLKVTRYAPDGKIECSGLYRRNSLSQNLSEPSLRISYPSNCKVVTLENNNVAIRFERITAPVEINPLIPFPSPILPTG